MERKLYNKLDSLLVGVSWTVELERTVNLVFALCINEYEQRRVGTESG